MPYAWHLHAGRVVYSLSLRELELEAMGLGGHPVDSPNLIDKVPKAQRKKRTCPR